MESMKRVISLMPLRTRAKHNIHSRFRREVWMCQQCCPILSLGHDLSWPLLHAAHEELLG